MARLTAKQRKKLPASEFALGKGHYPVDTANRARAALSYSKRFASPTQQATIRRKVASKYPGMQLMDAHRKRKAKR